MQTDVDSDAVPLPRAGFAARLRDLTLALFWSDAAAGMVIVTLGTPPLVIALAVAGHVLVGSSAEGRHLLLALSLAIGLLYCRGVLQLGRADAWWRALYRNTGIAVQALPLRSVLAPWRPEVLDASIQHPWTQARRWAWAAGGNLLAWVGILAWLPADSPSLVSFWLAGLGVLSMTWLLGRHHRWMLRAIEAFIAADNGVLG